MKVAVIFVMLVRTVFADLNMSVVEVIKTLEITRRVLGCNFGYFGLFHIMFVVSTRFQFQGKVQKRRICIKSRIKTRPLI